QVQAGTIRVFKAIEATPGKKPSRLNEQDSLRLSDQEKEIIVEANKAIEMIRDEGSAVAFAEVFNQVRDDMIDVQRRLEKIDVGTVTQAVEQDIIDMLKEMIEALKKAQQKNQSKPSQGSPGPPPDQRLLDLIAELKMIRSMQIRINGRTTTYAREYVPREG